jgi:hypothetical protein
MVHYIEIRRYLRTVDFDTFRTDVGHTLEWLELPVGIPGIVQYISDKETVQIGCGCVNYFQFEILLNSYFQCIVTQKIVFHPQCADLCNL